MTATRLAQAVAWLDRHALRLLVVAIVLFALGFATIAVVKFSWFGYNGLDLGIYTQVFEHSRQGDLFGLTIHPHRYLGDHVELILLALLPIYVLLPLPQTLLGLQALVLALAGLAVFRLARNRLSPVVSLLVSFAYLANPVVQNSALYEFHALPFAIPVLLLAIDAYRRQRWWLFFGLTVLSLTVREDVGLVILGFGLLALIDRRQPRWWLTPLLLGGAWFIVSLAVAGTINGTGAYKFLGYYGWLGDSLPEVLRNVLIHPERWLSRLVSLETLELSIGSLAPLFFLPLLKPRWLLPALPVMLQLATLRAQGEVILQIHYAALLIPFLFAATIDALAALKRGERLWFGRAWPSWQAIVVPLLTAASLYFAVVLGPLAAAPRALAQGVDREALALQRAFVRQVPPEAALATTFVPIQQTAQRQQVYSLSYVFLGRRQFSREPYHLPDDVEYLLIDHDDLLRFELIYPSVRQEAGPGFARLQALLDRGFRLVAWEDHLSLWQQGQAQPNPLVFEATRDVRTPKVSLGPALSLVRPDDRLVPTNSQALDRSLTILPLDLDWQVTGPVPEDYELALRLYQDDQLVHEKYYPLGSGFLPTSTWTPGRTIRTRYRVRLPGSLRGLTEVRVALVDLRARTFLTGLRSIGYQLQVAASYGPEVTLGSVSLPTTR